ncbi:MAG: cell division protein SepF [Oscillospiraceae bacterium]|nr:cell division protein SepF [Oscillospiraceae bacterium]
MKFIDTLRDFFAPSEDDSYENEPVRETRAESRFERERKETPEREYTRETRTESREVPSARGGTEYGSQRGKVVNIQATAQLQVVLVKPEVFTDAKQIADHLIAKKTVVLNLETASAENKRRIIDFLVGVAYANGGSLKPVANLTYIITPYNVGFIGEDLVSELETNGVIM